MRRRALFVLSGLSACNHHAPMRDVHELANHRVTIETSRHLELEAIAIESNTVEGMTFQTDSGTSVGLSDVATVTDIRRGRGALEGGAIGAGLGIVGGIALGYAGGGDPPCERGDACGPITTAGQYAFIGAVVFGALGGALGLVVGYARGSHFVYEF